MQFEEFMPCEMIDLLLCRKICIINSLYFINCHILITLRLLEYMRGLFIKVLKICFFDKETGRGINYEMPSLRSIES